MKKNYHILLSSFALIVLHAPVVNAQQLVQATPESAGFASERLARLTETLENYVEQEKLPGTVTLVARSGKIIC